MPRAARIKESTAQSKLQRIDRLLLEAKAPRHRQLLEQVQIQFQP